MLFRSALLGIVWSLINTKYIDYNPINGDFQNYNPVRRLLSGQIPFKDFSVYLGCGQLYLEAFLLSIIGNTFKNSLCSMYFLSVFCFWISIMVVVFLVTKSKFFAILSANILIFFNIARPAFFVNNMVAELWEGFNAGIIPGNSARLIRAFVTILLAWIILLRIKKVYYKKNKIEEVTFFIAFISGIMLLWSNDYGVVTSFSMGFVYLVIIFKCFWKDWKLILKQVGIYIPSYLVGMIISILFVTKFHIKDWFLFMFGVGKYQQWYYETQIPFKTYYIYEINSSILSILSLFLALYYLFRIIKEKTFRFNIDNFIQNGLLAYLFLTVFLGTNFYHLLSGGVSEELLQVVLAGYGIGILTKQITKINRKTVSKILMVVNLFMIVYSISNLYYFIMQNNITYGYQYIGGKIDAYLNDSKAESLKTVQEKLNGKAVFSTYASAVEAYMDFFQPTKYDYIIHVLGDRARKEYIDIFIQGNYDYVATIREDYTPWEYWIRNANWFFYRELYAEYIPDFSTDYQLYWKKGNVSIYKEMPVIEVEKIEDKIKIVLKYKEAIDAVADVRLVYNTEYKFPFYQTGAFKKMIHVDSVSQKNILQSTEKIYADFFIPEEADPYYIPITIIDGYGEVILDGVPLNQVKINITDVVVKNIFFIK